MFYRLNEQEILDLLDKLDQDELEPGNIVLHLPDEHDRTASDCDSDNSDEESAGDLNKLGPVLMKTTCDFVPHGSYAVSSDTEDEETEQPLAKKNKKNEKKVIQWTSEEPNFKINKNKLPVSPLPEEVMSTDTEYELFRLFIDQNFIDNLVKQTNMYAVQQDKILNVNSNEILVVLGAFMLSGYAKYPDKRLYWSKDSDTPTILCDAIRCRRFEDIIHNMHFNDNTQIDREDRLYKLRPLLEHLQSKFLVLNPLDEHLSIDESMIPYYGRHFAKQFIKGKPIRFGYKNWALCSSNGYMYAFDVYTGKNKEASRTELGVGGDVVMNLIKKAKVPCNKGFKVYFDNYFTSFKLLNKLSSIGICATGTIRENRLQNCPLPKKESFKKSSKWSHKFSTSSSILVVKYNDKNTVNVATNFDCSRITSVKRFSAEKKIILIFLSLKLL